MMWYVRRGEREIGPLGEDALRALVGTGQITPDTQLWHEGLSGWTAAVALPGVFGPRTAAPVARAAASPPGTRVPPRQPAAPRRARLRIWVAAGVCLLAVAALIAFGLHWLHDAPGYSAEQTPAPLLQQELAQAADRINASGPRMIDDITRLDGAQVSPGPMFTYEYTLTSISVRVLSATDLETLRARLSAHVRQVVCSGTALQPVLRTGVTTGFHYRDRDGQNLVMVHISSADCGR